MAHAPGLPGTFPRHGLQTKPLVNDPGMHRGAWVTHVPWCLSGSLTRGGGEKRSRHSRCMRNPQFYVPGMRPMHRLTVCLPHVAARWLGKCHMLPLTPWNADIMCIDVYLTWWRHQMETFSALLALCAGSFDVFFDLRLSKRLSKQSRRWWFEMPSRSLWRHCNDFVWICWGHALYFCIGQSLLNI